MVPKNEGIKGRKKGPGKKNETLVLKLYVAGLTLMSLKAIENIRKLCKTYISNGYEIEVRDIRQNPIFAKDGQIIAAPTLIKELPLPVRRFIGDMSNTEKLLVGLDIETKGKETREKKLHGKVKNRNKRGPARGE